MAAEYEPLPPHGYWEAAFVINGNVSLHQLDRDFLRNLDANNPRFTGWPVWRTAERATDESKRPGVYDNRIYETLAVNSGSEWYPHIDFMRIFIGDISVQKIRIQLLQLIEITLLIFGMVEALKTQQQDARQVN